MLTKYKAVSDHVQTKFTGQTNYHNNFSERLFLQKLGLTVDKSNHVCQMTKPEPGVNVDQGTFTKVSRHGDLGRDKTPVMDIPGDSHQYWLLLFISVVFIQP